MTTFTVKWETEIEADSAAEAAQIARKAQLDKHSVNLCFDVLDSKGNEEMVDLLIQPSLDYFNELQEKLVAFDTDIILSTEYSEQAFNDEVHITTAVQDYFTDHEFNLDSLTPLAGECEEFSAQVNKLNRPYAYISGKQQSELLNKEFDFYATSGGLVVTFGYADGGYALMPLNKDAAKLIKANQ